MTPRLVATDLDGTLLRSDGTVSPRTADVLLAVEATGVRVVFVTARPIRWMHQLRRFVGAHGTVICSNGAVVLDLRRDEVLLSRPLDQALVRQVVAAVRQALPGTTFAVEALSGFAKEPGFVERTPSPPGSRVGPIEEVAPDDVLKLMARHEDMGAESFRAAVQTAVRDRAEATSSDASALVELSAPGVTKASTLALLCARLGVDREEVLAFGDAPNDVAMLAWAGRSFAVAGAHPEAVAVATDRASGNDEDGVAAVLEVLLRP